MTVALELKPLPYDLTVCKVASPKELPLSSDFYFVGKTDEELSLVCLTKDVPAAAEPRDDGWKAFRIRESWIFP